MPDLAALIASFSQSFSVEAISLICQAGPCQRTAQDMMRIKNVPMQKTHGLTFEGTSRSTPCRKAIEVQARRWSRYFWTETSYVRQSWTCKNQESILEPLNKRRKDAISPDLPIIPVPLNSKAYSPCVQKE
jgi:hypothetical protein